MEDQRTSLIPPWLQRLGSRIRLARRARGLTQTDAAGPGLTKSFVSLLESGRTYPSVGTLVTMADRLQTSLGQLLLDRPQLTRETALNLVMLARESPPNGAVDLLLDAAETLAGDSDDLQVELRLTRGDVAASQDRPKDADRWFREALTQAKKRRLQAFEPRARARLATLAFQSGDLNHARTEVEDALAAFRSSRTLRTVDGCSALILLGTILVRNGKPARALRNFEDAARIAERERLGAVLGRAYAGIGQAHGAARHFNRAIDSLQRARDKLQAAGDSEGLTVALHQLGRLQLETGQADHAQETLEHSTQLLKEQNDPSLRVAVLTDLAWAQLRAGRIAQAQSSARSAVAIAAHTHDSGLRGRALRVQGNVARAQRRFKQAVEILKESVATLRRARLPEELTGATQELDALMRDRSAPAGGASEFAGTGARPRGTSALRS